MNDLTVTDHRSLVLRYNRTAIAMTDALGSFFQYRQPQTLFTSESMQTLVFMCSNSQELFQFCHYHHYLSSLISKLMLFWSKLTSNIPRNNSNIYLKHYFDNENTILNIVNSIGAKKRHFHLTKKQDVTISDQNIF